MGSKIIIAIVLLELLIKGRIIKVQIRLLGERVGDDRFLILEVGFLNG
jgi:hypothetical protein